MMKLTSAIDTESQPDVTVAAATPALHPSRWARFVMAGLLLLSAGVGLASVMPFSKLSHRTSAYSLSQALAHWRAIGETPRLAGSAGHETARNYIFSKIKQLGIPANLQQVQTVFQRPSGDLIAGTVHNIIATIQGKESRGTILVTAHYDSVPNSPGAHDDALAVAAMLEAMRVLKETSNLVNDVVFLFTDAEEQGLLGARAFLDRYRPEKGPSVVLNFDARGANGPLLMFESGKASGGLIKELGSSGISVVANSAMQDLYGLLPNNTDFSIFRQADWPGLNFAYIADSNRYHTALDRVRDDEAPLLGVHCALIVALTRRLGETPLNGRLTNQGVFFNIPGVALVSYPRNLAVVPIVLAAILLASGIAFALKRQLFSMPKLLAAVGFILILLVIGYLMTLILLWAIGLWRGQFLNQYAGDSKIGGGYLFGFYLLTFACTLWGLTFLARRLGALNVALGACVWWLVLAAVSNWFWPGLSYIFAWPALFGAGTLLVGLFSGQNDLRLWKVVLLAVLALPGFLLFTPIFYLTFVGLGLGMAPYLMVLAALHVALLFPQLKIITDGRRLLPLMAVGGGGVAVLLVVSSAWNFNSDYPRADDIFYTANGDTGVESWATSRSQMSPWKAKFFGAGIRYDRLELFFPGWNREFVVGPAPDLQLPLPQARLTEARAGENGYRTLRLAINSPRHAARMSIDLDKAAEIASIVVNGQVFKRTGASMDARRDWRIEYFTAGMREFELTIDVRGPLALRLVDQSYGLPNDVDTKSRPASLIPAANGLADSIIAGKSYTF
jgi:hypothetical protein